MSVIVSPSLLAADFMNLGKDVEMVDRSKADWIHLDIMDGVFVPNISYGLPVVSQIKKIARKPLDVHLMIVQPERYVEAFHKAGADILTVHLEASTHLHRTLQQIKVKKLKALIQATHSHTLIEIDGGVNFETGRELVTAGADALVAGSFVFKSEDPEATIAGLKNLKTE